MCVWDEDTYIHINDKTIIHFCIYNEYVFFDYFEVSEQSDVDLWPYIKSEHLLKYIRNMNRVILPFVSSINKLNDKYKIDED